MKKLIFQINVPNYIKTESIYTTYSYHQEMYNISERNARRYAKKTSSDYYKLTDPADFKLAEGKHLDYQKLKAYDFIDYDRIIYFDSDYIIKDNAPDLFEICGNQFHAVPDQGKIVENSAKSINIPKDRYFNAGFMYLTKNILDKTRDALPEYLKTEYAFQGQCLLNKLFFDFKIDYTSLNFKDWNPVKQTWGTYSDHYSGKKKERWGIVDYGN